MDMLHNFKYLHMIKINSFCIIFALLLLSVSFDSHSQTRRAPEIKSCLTTEFAFASLENADPKKNWDANVEIGKKIGYVIATYYQKAIWAMDEPDIEGREVLNYALENFQKRIKYIKRDALKQEIDRCRLSFN